MGGDVLSKKKKMGGEEWCAVGGAGGKEEEGEAGREKVGRRKKALTLAMQRWRGKAVAGERGVETKKMIRWIRRREQLAPKW